MARGCSGSIRVITMKWEYDHIEEPFTDYTNAYKELNNQLEVFGGNDWELISVIKGERYLHAYLKRPLTN